MEAIRSFWGQFVHFLEEYNSQKIIELIRTVDWRGLAVNPLAWFIFLLLMGYVVWRRKIRPLILACSVVAFVFLLQYTLPAAGGSIPLADLIKFLAGVLGLVGLNVYLFFIRD